MTDDELHEELQNLLDVVATTRSVGAAYSQDLIERGQPDVAQVIDGALEIISHLVDMVVRQDQLLQMVKPGHTSVKRERVH